MEPGPFVTEDSVCKVCGVKLWVTVNGRTIPTAAATNTFYSDLCNKHCIEHMENIGDEDRRTTN